MVGRISSSSFIRIHYYLRLCGVVVLVIICQGNYYNPIDSFIIPSSTTGSQLNRLSSRFITLINNKHYTCSIDTNRHLHEPLHQHHHHHRQLSKSTTTQLYLAPKSAKRSSQSKLTKAIIPKAESKSPSSSSTTTTLVSSEFLSDYQDNYNTCVDIIDGPFRSLQLRNYWGKKPLLVRKAFDLKSNEVQDAWPSWDDIVELSSWDDNISTKNSNTLVESGESARFIHHTSNKLDSFDLEIGPFERQYLQNIMKQSTTSNNKWTLIVNDVNRYIESAQQWMDRTFNFVPKWRHDDIQISLAPNGGGIGPHVDNYDVCLIQMSGQRLWEIFPTNYLSVQEEYNMLMPNIPVRILNVSSSTQFQSNNDNPIDFARLVLNPGDMLYLPPRIIHCGTGIGKDDNDVDCMTLSVGFRSPSASDIVSFLAESIQQSTHNSAVLRYTDDKMILSTDDHHSNNQSNNPEPSITASVRSDFKDLILNAINTVIQNETEWDKLIGEIVTQSIRYSENVVIPYDEITDDSIRDVFGETAEDVVRRIATNENQKMYLIRCSGISFATSRITSNDDSHYYIDRIYADGSLYGEATNDPLAGPIFHRIETGQKLSAKDLQAIYTSNEKEYQSSLFSVLTNLVQEGILKPTME